MSPSLGWWCSVSMAVALCAAGPHVLRAAGPTTSTAAASSLDGLWDDLGSPDQAKVAAAVLKLIGYGDRAAGFLGRKLEAKKPVVDAGQIARLLKELDADAWQKREKARKALSEMGPPVAPFLREALLKKPSVEVRIRVEGILAEQGRRVQASPDARRRGWALPVLGRIASARALDTLLMVHDRAIETDRPGLDTALLNLAERAVPRLIDAAGSAAAAGDRLAAAKACARALAIAEKTGHYSQGRIRAVLDGLRAGAKAKARAPLPPIAWTAIRGENLLTNEGFEVRRWQGSWPTKSGIWGGDHAEMVGGQQGVTPRDGKAMLKFVATNFRSAGAGTGAQVVQVLDVAKSRQAVASGKARAVASALFNRLAGDARTDTFLGVSLIAYGGSPARHFAMSQQRSWLAQNAAAIHTDADPATWQKLSVRLRVPKGTSFLVVQLLAVENIANDLRAPEFEGHYADSAFVTLVAPGPGDKGDDVVAPARGPPPPPPQKPPEKRILRLQNLNLRLIRPPVLIRR